MYPDPYSSRLVQGQPFQASVNPLPASGFQQYMGQQEHTFLALDPTRFEGDNTLVYNPPQLPTETPRPACPICERMFTRTQERNRHLRTYLPHYIYCPFPGCPWRCDRHDNLRNHWQKKHADCGQAPQKQECEIYNPDSFVKLVTCGQMSIEEAANAALFEVILRAFEEGKQDLWSENWSGRRSQHREH